MSAGTIARPRRDDIQGLRAIAVIMVLLYHIGDLIKSGYIGVDIFFVVSGYVIAMAYLDKFIREPNAFTAIDFFHRRLLRLAPAFLVAIAFTLVLTNLIIPPTENKLFAIEAGLASVLQKSNIYFRDMGTNYWLDTLSRNPFLHTWSLGVEWQFYALFPVPFFTIALLRRFQIVSHKVILHSILVIAFVLSLGYFLSASPTNSFYGPWSRFWQFTLGIGAFLATRRYGRPEGRDAFALLPVAGILALALLPLSVLGQTVSALLASVFTAVLLYAAPSHRTSTGRLLASPVLQSIGHASYSIYLTHWPVAVLGRIWLGEGPLCDFLLVALSMASGFLLSWSLEYRFVNAAQPLRATMACLAAVGLAGAGWGAKQHIPKLPWYASTPLIADIEGFHNFWWTETTGAEAGYKHSARFRMGEIYRKYIPDTDVYEAVAEHSPASRWIVGIGNSYIQSSGAMLRRVARENDASLSLFHISNCTRESRARCARGFEHVAKVLEAQKEQIKILYVAFSAIGDGDPRGLVAELTLQLLSRIDHPELQVVIQGPSPALKYDPHKCLSLLQPCASTLSLPANVDTLLANERAVANAFQGHKFSVWSPFRDLCTESACLYRQDGASLFMDSNHFSNVGQRHLYPALSRAIKRSLLQSVRLETAK